MLDEHARDDARGARPPEIEEDTAPSTSTSAFREVMDKSIGRLKSNPFGRRLKIVLPRCAADRRCRRRAAPRRTFDRCHHQAGQHPSTACITRTTPSCSRHDQRQQPLGQHEAQLEGGTYRISQAMSLRNTDTSKQHDRTHPAPPDDNVSASRLRRNAQRRNDADAADRDTAIAPGHAHGSRLRLNLDRRHTAPPHETPNAATQNATPTRLAPLRSGLRR